MVAEQNAIGTRKGNLALAFQELLTATVRLRYDRQRVPDAEAFRARMREAYRSSVHDALAKGYSQQAVDNAGYAAMAFLDESVIAARNFAFSNWSASPMAKEMFPEIAGENFFRTIEELLAASNSQENADVLEVFLLALLLGHRGRYAIGGADELAAVMLRVKEKIAAVRGTNAPLSPAWALPAEPIASPPPDPVRRTCFAVAVGSLAICLLTFAVSKFLLMSGASQIHGLLK
ncbi:MAG: DotU family type IV/VI secretion system protein [Acidobacteria bacterium]|nr:DotU family type IV/VI secretion system protein [Acidobacteriota bacterium]